MKITQGYIRKLKPRTGSRYHITKDNLEARVEPSGRVLLSYKYVVGSQKKRLKIAQLPNNSVTRDQALELDNLFQELVYRHHKHGDFIGVAVKGVTRREEAKKSKVTLADASEEYLEEFLRTKKTGSQEIIYHRYILTYLKDHDPREITGPELQAVINHAGKGNNPKFKYRTTAHHVGKSITRFWRWMKQNGYVDSIEVSRDLKRPGMRKSHRYYSDKELVEYLKDAPLAIQAIAYCPMRASEMLRLNWDEFEGSREDGGWHNMLVKSEEDEDHVVRFWLTPEFMRYVSPNDGYFFRGRWGKDQLKQNSLSEMFRNRRKKLEIGQDRDGVHIFRKNLSTWAQSQGYPDRHWRMCLGHSIPGLTGIYGLHQYEEEKRELWRSWAVHLDQLRGSAQ